MVPAPQKMFWLLDSTVKIENYWVTTGHQIVNMINTTSNGSKTIYIVGDFNTGNKTKLEKVQNQLKNLDFYMHVTIATHIGGNTLDNIITKNAENIKHYLHNLYYSDHDALYFDIMYCGKTI